VTGKKVVPPEYEALSAKILERARPGHMPPLADVLDFLETQHDPVTDEIFPFARDGRWGFLDNQGRVVVGARFLKAHPFGKEVPLAPVMIGRKWGYIDRTGAMVIEPEFSDAMSFDGELAVVEMKNSIGYVNRGGKVVHLTAYSELVAP
jgi:hypothetical protein